MNVYWLEQEKTDVPEHCAWLSANELVFLSRMHFPRRCADWRLGRWTAKRALAAYWKWPAVARTLASIEIRAAPSGAPEVFVEGSPAAVTISLSHRAGRAMCAIASAGVALGCDLEEVEPHSEAFVADYFSVEEQALVAHTGPTQRPVIATLLWSAKESALKALHTGLRRDTRSVIVKLLAHSKSLLENAERVERADLHLRLFLEDRGWRPLRVRDAEGGIFRGWWRQDSAHMLRTVVAAPSANQPIPLDLSSYEWLAQKEANHEIIRSAA